MNEKIENKKPARSWFKRNFITGLIVLVPITGTIFLFAWAFNKATNSGLNLLLQWQYFKDLYVANKLFYDVLGRIVVLIIIFIIIFLTGVFMRNLIGRRIFRLTEKLFESLPVFNRVFQALKEISKSLMSSGSSLFAYAVLFEYPRKGTYTVGFVMSESFPEAKAIIGKDVLNIFLITAPNPTTGFSLIVPKDETIRLSMTVEEALRLVISGGAVVPDYIIKEITGKNPQSPCEKNPDETKTVIDR